MTEEDHILHDREAKEAIQNNIEKYGYHLALIEPDNYLPGFVYTIGLFQKFGHPELICFGLDSEVMGAIINYASDIIKNGEVLTTEKRYSGFIRDYDIQFLSVNEEYYSEYVGYGAWFYNSFNFPLLQIIWPDKNNIFPWDVNFNPDWKFKQPLLDRDTDFKFYEERNLGVYTTKQVFEGDPILYVYHDDDGNWQFHTGQNPSAEDAMIVSLEQIVKQDDSINEVYYLQYGWRAWRESKDSDWEIEESKD